MVHEANTSALIDHMTKVKDRKKVSRACWITMMLGFNSLPTKVRCRFVAKENEKAIRGVGDARLLCALCGVKDDDVHSQQ